MGSSSYHQFLDLTRGRDRQIEAAVEVEVEDEAEEAETHRMSGVGIVTRWDTTAGIARYRTLYSR